MGFDEETIQKVWEKGETVVNNDSNVWRKDQCSAWINRLKYGDQSSDYGWHVDHITPKEKGGTDVLSNLRPLQWKNNVDKSDGRLKCNVKSNGSKNVEE